MALNLITNPTSVLTLSSQWTDFVAREDKSNVGNGLTIDTFRLTNFDTGSAIPQIAKGSIVEVGGSLYQADSDTALTADAGLTDGPVHIKLVPVPATPDPLTVTPTITSDSIPSFDAEKGGWYDSDDKFLPYGMNKSGSSYTAKFLYEDQNKLIKKFADGGMYLSKDLSLAGNLSVSGGIEATGNISSSGNVSCSNVDTGAGAVKCFEMDQPVRTTDSPDFNRLELASDLTVGGQIVPDSPGLVSYSLAGGATYTLPRGIYVVESEPGGVVPEMNIGGWTQFSWDTTITAETVISDGVNARVRNTNVSARSARWYKF